MRIRLPPRLAAALAGPGIGLLARSWRIQTVGQAAWQALAEAGQPYILLSWHEALLPLLWRHRGRGITIVVSEALDGRYLAGYARRLGYREAWGSSTRGGVRALLGAVKAIKAGGPAAFTPDGPRGPRRVLKDGALLAAQRGGAPIVALHAAADRRWTLRSWDRFMIPRLFARVRIAYGTPFQVGPGDAGLAEARERTMVELEHVVREAGWDDAATPTG